VLLNKSQGKQPEEKGEWPSMGSLSTYGADALPKPRYGRQTAALTGGCMVTPDPRNPGRGRAGAPNQRHR